MPRALQHQEEWDRIGGMEHNVAIDQTDMFGPSRRFEEKSQSSNPSNAGGINRPTKGKKGDAGKGQSSYPQHSSQGRNATKRMGSPNKGKVSHAAKHKGAGG
jgi:hypothetical protein